MSSQSLTNTPHSPSNSIAIISVGNQAQSWALNLYESGVKVEIAYRAFNDKVKKFQSENPQIPCVLLNLEWLKKQSIIALLIPDHEHLNFLQQYHDSLPSDCTIIYAHGFSQVAYKISHRFPQFQHALLAPKAIASELRKNYQEKKTLAAVYGLASPPSCDEATLSQLQFIAKKLGITWGPFLVSFEQECKADLFSEQTLLCNLLPHILDKAHQTLIDKNIPWELAFCEIFLELKLIVNALEEVGPEKFYQLISPNALMGSEFYRQQWEKNLPLEKLFAECWKSLESGEMIDYLVKTNAEPVRENIVKKWKNNSLSIAYNRSIS